MDVTQSFVLSLLILVGLLNHDEEEVLVGGDENLLSASAHSEEGHIVHGVDVTHDAPRLHRQIRDVVSDVLRGRRCVLLVPLGDDATLVIYDQQCAHTGVVTDPINALLEVSHFKFSVTIFNLISPKFFTFL